MIRIFDGDSWREILEPLRTAKLRTAATALSVAWGIFMLVILLGAGNGFQNGAEYAFRDNAVNTIMMRPLQTTKAHAGYGPGRAIKFNNEDYDALRGVTPEVEHATGRYYFWNEFTVAYGSKTSSFDVRGVHPDHLHLERTLMTSGRYINETDLAERRKVAVVGLGVVERLFDKRDSPPPVGQWLSIRGVSYRIVGVFEDEGDDDERTMIYVPVTTAQTVYGEPSRLHQIRFSLTAEAAPDSQAIAARTRRLLAARHHIAPDDKRALQIWDGAEDYQKVSSIFSSLRFFVWIVGIGTILAGIIGVSNIMLISVRERTQELGLRKALGATPSSIVRQIVLESLIITAASGYAGLISGLGLLELVARYVPPNDTFRNPEADLGVVISATLVIIACGVLAGYFPARMAARINPVEALRAD